MKHRPIPSTFETRLLAAWQSQLASAQSAVLPAERQALFHRFARHYHSLCALRRRVRRQLARQWKRSLPALALLLALGQAPALAATLPVATGVPPDINNDGLCALVEAIENANADAAFHDDCIAGSGADTIVVPAGSTQTLTAVDNTTLGATGLPVITSPITIEGNNSTLVREGSAPEFRILAIDDGGDLTLNETTVSGGVTAGDGGGVIMDVTSIDAGATLTMSNSTISGNTAGRYGGGVANYSFVYSNTLTVTNSTIIGNTAFRGGGVFNSDGIVTVSSSIISGNSAYTGGGIHNWIFGIVTLTDSTISGNSASYAGGGVNNNPASRVYASNSTLSGNTAGSKGGGVYSAGGYLTLGNSTLSGNSAGSKGGGAYVYPGSHTLARTLVSGNTASVAPEIYRDVTGYGSFTADNFNLFGNDGDAGVVGFTPGPTDLVPNEPLTALLETTLANNGGPTLTHALISGSPAVDASPVDADCPATDQRGVTRPQGAACDIGAFEREAGTATPCASAIPTGGCTLNGVPNRLCQGSSAADEIFGTPGNDVIFGRGGGDSLRGRGGADLLCGGLGHDVLLGGSGTDQLLGGGGNDTLNGGPDPDIADGGAGTDTCASTPEDLPTVRCER